MIIVQINTEHKTQEPKHYKTILYLHDLGGNFRLTTQTAANMIKELFLVKMVKLSTDILSLKVYAENGIYQQSEPYYF